MKKYTIPVLLGAILISFTIAMQISKDTDAPYTVTEPYNITQPYRFPELSQYAPDYQKEAARLVPDKISFNMTTDALLDTFLHATNIFYFPVYQYNLTIQVLIEHRQYGLDVLIQREDLYDSLIKRYRTYKTYYNCFFRFYSAEKQQQIRDEQYDTNERFVDMIELLAAQIDYTGREEDRLEFEAAIQKRREERLASRVFYNERLVESPYYMSLHEKKVWDEINSRR